MLTKQEFTKYIETMTKYRKYIETLEDIKLLGNDIFSSPLGLIFEEMYNNLNLSERAKDVIYHYCWDRKYCYNEKYGYLTEYGDWVPDNIDELYITVMTLSYKEIIKERIDFYLGDPLSEFRHHLEYTSLWNCWNDNEDDEDAYKIWDFEEESKGEEFENEMNEYIKEKYPNSNAEVSYEIESIMLLNRNDDVNKDLFCDIPEWVTLDYFYGGDHLSEEC